MGVRREDQRVRADRMVTSDWADVARLAPTLSLVLLSHSPSQYIGLYPYARARWGLKCPVYATQPTVEMGRVVCLAEAEGWRSEHDVQDPSSSKRPSGVTVRNGEAGESAVGEDEAMISSKPLHGPFVPTLEEVHEAFDAIKPIRYNQPLHLGGKHSYRIIA